MRKLGAFLLLVGLAFVARAGLQTGDYIGASGVVFTGGTSGHVVTAAGDATIQDSSHLTVSSSVVTTDVGLVTTPQALSGAGAINVTTAATAFTSTGSGQALTLANGTAGQIKTIAHVVDGGSGILTPTTKSGYSTITFTNAGDAVTLQYFTTAGWVIIGQNGVTVAP